MEPDEAFEMVFEALARGYTTEKNRGKTLDSDLTVAMAEQIMELLDEKGVNLV